MKTSFKELESPYFEGELEFLDPVDELSKTIAQAIDESPFSRVFEQGHGFAYLSETEQTESFDEEDYAETESNDESGEGEEWGASEEEAYFEHDQPSRAQIPPPTIAAGLAIAPFAATLKNRLFPFLPPNKNKDAINWNNSQHPRVSGVDPQLILDSLKNNYVDLPSIEAEITRHNNANPSAPIDLSAKVVNGVFVEAVHQFQQKCFTDKGQHDGKAGAKVLHSLGIIQPKGKNPLAQVNDASKTKIKDKGITGKIGNTVIDHSNWFDFIVNPSIVGWTTDKDPGIHYELAKKLRFAENLLLAMPAFKNLSPAELGQALGITEVHKGYRRTKTNDSQHNFGLGIDISYDPNPWIRGSKVLEVIKDASLLHGRSVPDFAGAGYAQKYLFSLSSKYSTDQIHDILRQHHEDFVNYLSYANNLTKIKELLSRSASAGLVKDRESLDAAAARWQRKIKAHLADMKGDLTFLRNNGTRRNPLNGFLSHKKELVVALRDKACLAWGAVDLGEGVGASGDVMHFDMRSISPFSKIRDTAEFHPCRPGNTSQTTTHSKDREVESEHFDLMQFQTPQKAIQLVGWRDASPGGKSKIVSPPSGSAGWNKDKWKVGQVWRIPLEELKNGFQKPDKLPSWTDESAAGKAIALIPQALDATKIQEVLLYFHGDGPGYRQANQNFCIFANSKKGCLEKGWVEDVDTARIAQQLQSSARPIMAVLPQCPHGGARGEWPSNCDVYLDEIFDRLFNAGIWKQKPSDFRVILAGHSRGGDTIAKMIESRKKLLPTNLAQLTIFDGIHSSRYQIWAIGRLTADLKKIEGLTDSNAQLNYLQASMKFRAYHAGPSYTDRHDALEKAIKGWFVINQQRKPSISTEVWGALRANYQVISAGHEDHFLVGLPMNGAVSEPPLLNALKSLPVVRAGGAHSPELPEFEDYSADTDEFDETDLRSEFDEAEVDLELEGTAGAEADDMELEDEVLFTGAEEDEGESELFEGLVPKVSEADLRNRIDEYFNHANAEYTLSGGTKVMARPQFHYAKTGAPEKDAETVRNILEKKFGKKFTTPLRNAIRCAAYGRARPDEIKVITQALIEAGELDTVRSENSGFHDDQLVRALQRKFNIGIDCAGYVQLAFIYAFTGKHDHANCNLAASKLREDLGLKPRRSWENLAYLEKKHFTEVGFLNGQTGDLLVLAWRNNVERDWHTVIVVDHTVSGDLHTFEVDASWGFLYGEDAAGVARRKFKYDKSAGKWWDIHPINGTKEFENSIGPYNEHPIKGMYRAKQKK